MTIKITFLGTSDSKPTKERNHTAILLSYEGENILVDCGEGTQRQFQIAELNPCKLTSILLTHWHGDHMFGLPGLMQTLALSTYAKQLEIFGPKGIRNKMKALSELYGPFRIKYHVHETQAHCLETEKYIISAAPLEHTTHSNAYSFEIKEQRRIHKEKLAKLKLPNTPLIKQLQLGKDITFQGKKIKAKDLTYIQEGKKVAFVLDTLMNQNAVKIAKDADALICEATFSDTEAQHAKEHFHLTAKQAAQIAKKAKVKKLVLTHISQRYQHQTDLLLKEAKSVFKNTVVAKDFDTIEI